MTDFPINVCIYVQIEHKSETKSPLVEIWFQERDVERHKNVCCELKDTAMKLRRLDKLAGPNRLQGP